MYEYVFCAARHTAVAIIVVVLGFWDFGVHHPPPVVRVHPCCVKIRTTDYSPCTRNTMDHLCWFVVCWCLAATGRMVPLADCQGTRVGQTNVVGKKCVSTIAALLKTCSNVNNSGAFQQYNCSIISSSSLQSRTRTKRRWLIRFGRSREVHNSAHSACRYL